MRLYRYLFFILLFSVGIWLTSIETVRIWQQISRDSYPHLSIKLTTDNRDELIDMLGNLSQKHNVNVMISSYEADSNDNIYYTYYADTEAVKTLEQNWNYSECTVRDSFAGRYTYYFRLKPLEKAKELLYDHLAAFIGNENDIRQLEAEISEYAAAHFDIGTVSRMEYNTADIKGMSRNYIIFLWLGIIAALTVMTAMETAVFRKEAVVLLTNGCSFVSMIGKRLLVDVSACSLLLAAVSVILVVGIGFPAYSLVYALTALGVLMLCTSVIYSTLIFSNIRAALAGAKQGAKVLLTNYVIKTAAVACCAVLSLSAADTVERNKVGSDAEELINKYFGGYVYADITGAAMLSSRDDAEAFLMQKEIYHDHYEDMKPVRFTLGTLDSVHQQLETNYYAIDYLRSQIPEMSKLDESSRVTLVLRKGADYVDIAQNEEWVKERFSTEKYGETELQVIYYNDPLELMYIGADTATGIAYVSDPVIMLYNMDPVFLDEIGWHGQSITALKLGDESIDALCSQYDFYKEALKPVSVIERYESHWKVIKASILSQILLAASIAAIVLMVGMTIVKYTFIAHAKELCIRKILGHSVVARYFKLFLINIVIYSIGAAASYFAVTKMHIQWNKATLFPVLTLLLATDTLMTALRIIKQERTNAQKILKGGAL